MGCPLIMGRKTWDSIGKLAWKGKYSFNTKPKWHKNGAIKASSIEEGINWNKLA